MLGSTTPGKNIYVYKEPFKTSSVHFIRATLEEVSSSKDHKKKYSI